MWLPGEQRVLAGGSGPGPQDGPGRGPLVPETPPRRRLQVAFSPALPRRRQQGGSVRPGARNTVTIGTLSTKKRG